MRSRLRLYLLIAAALSAGGAIAAERTTYFVTDMRGSPVAALDEQGAIVWRESYAPYGTRRQRALENAGNPAFTGKPESSDTGLIYMGARWYDPETARFTGPDPRQVDEADPQSFGRYLYANNSPYRYTDPNGESPIEGTISVIWDVGQVGTAMMTGAPVGPPLVDLGLDAAGFISPIPGTGYALKAGHKTSKLTQAIRETRAARHAPVETTQEGERFVRIADKTRALRRTPDGGVMPGTYAFPESTFFQLLTSSEGVKSLGDIPGGKPNMLLMMTPPAGTPIKRGIVPGGEFGGAGGAREVIFPDGF